MRRRVVVRFGLAAVVATLLTASCGGGGTPDPVPSADRATDRSTTTVLGSEDPAGWLAQDSNSVAFVQWFDSHGSLTGSMQLSNIRGSGTSHTVTGSTLSFTGSLSGSKIILTPEGMTAWFGTLTGDDLTLNIPQNDGSLAPAAFHRASIADYNRIIADLKGGASGQNDVAANEQEAAATQAAIAKQQKAIDADVEAVLYDLSKLSDDNKILADVVTSITAAVQAEVKAVGLTKTNRDSTVALARQHPDGASGDVCSAAYDVQSNAYDTQSALYDVQSVTYDVKSDLGGVRDRITTTTTDFARLQADMRLLPSYRATGTPSQAAVSNAVAASRAALASTVTQVNAQIDQANALVTTSYRYATDALQAGGCSSSAGSPSQIEHVS